MSQLSKDEEVREECANCCTIEAAGEDKKNDEKASSCHQKQRNERNEKRLQRRAQLNEKIITASEHGTETIRSKNARSKEFRDFLFETFPSLREYAAVEELRRSLFQSTSGAEAEQGDANNITSCCVSAADEGNAPTASPPSSSLCLSPPQYPRVYVLDVAGGKGEIAVPLRIKGIECGIVDPRADLKNMRKLMKFVDKSLNAEGPGAGAMMRRKLAERGESVVFIDSDGNELPCCVSSTRTSTLTSSSSSSAPSCCPCPHDPMMCRASIRLPQVFREWFSAEGEEDSEGLKKAKLECDVIIGMHPDQATEPIVDFALKHKKPFAIVPCCVFPKENQHRKLIIDKSSGDNKIVGIVDQTQKRDVKKSKSKTSSNSDCPTTAEFAREEFEKSGASSCTKFDNNTCSAFNESDTNNNNDRFVLEPVESYDQFLEYLKRKGDAVGAKIKTASLPIEGRSTILYCNEYNAHEN